MSTKDVIKNSVLEGFTTGEVTWSQILMTIAIAFVIGLFIMFIYKKTFSGVVFTRSFATSLILLSLVTSVIILTISSNLMLSLGMVGALSIVRFRTAVKDPIDTIFMFWAIAEGIVVGANLYLIAIISTIVIGLLLIVISLFKLKRTMPYILVLRFDERAKADVGNMLKKFSAGKLKNKTVSQGVIEMTLEMNVTDQDIALIDRFSHIEGVYTASIISYSGDVIA